MRIYWEIFQSHPVTVYILGSLILGGMFFGVFVSVLPEGQTPGAVPVIGIFFAASILVRYLQYSRQPLESGYTEMMHEAMLMEKTIFEWQEATACKTPAKALAAMKSLENKANKILSPPKEENKKKSSQGGKEIKAGTPEDDKVKGDLARYKALLNQVESEKKNLASSHSQLEAELKKLREEKKSMERQLSSKQSALDLATTQIANLEEQIKGLKSLAQEMGEAHKTEVLGLTEALQEDHNKIVGLREDLAIMERKIQARDRRLSENDAVIKEHHRVDRQLRESLEKANATKLDQLAQIEELRTFISEEGAVHAALTELVNVADQAGKISLEIQDAILANITRCMDAMESLHVKIPQN